MDALSESPVVSMVDHRVTAAYHVDYVTSKRGGKNVHNDEEACYGGR
jgi:hypothetical protein